MGKTEIDKISFTLHIPTIEERNSITHNLKYLLYGDGSQAQKNLYAIPTTKNGYRVSCKIFLNNNNSFGVHGEDSLIIQCDPKYENYNYLRAEFNPSKVNLSTVKGICDKLLYNGYERIISGVLTRIDTATLIHFCDIDDLIIHYPQMRKSTLHFSNGKLQTIYIGSKQGTHFVAYSKTQEIKEKNANLTDNFSEKQCSYPNYDLLRLEHCFKPKDKQYTLNDIPSLPNPFESLLIAEHYNFPLIKMSEEEETNFRFFLDSCRIRGISQALKIIKDKNRRAKYLKIVKSATVVWYHPNKIKEEIPALIHALQHPKDSPLPFYFPTFTQHHNLYKAA